MTYSNYFSRSCAPRIETNRYDGHDMYPISISDLEMPRHFKTEKVDCLELPNRDKNLEDKNLCGFDAFRSLRENLRLNLRMWLLYTHMRIICVLYIIVNCVYDSRYVYLLLYVHIWIVTLYVYNLKMLKHDFVLSLREQTEIILHYSSFNFRCES